MLRRKALQLKTEGTEKRLLWWMIACGLCATLVLLVMGHGGLAAGFATGAAIAILGFIWLEDVVTGALNIGTNRVSKKLVFKLIVRYPILLGSLYFFYQTNWLPAGAVLAGLFVPLAGAVVECVYQVGGMIHFFETRSGQ